MAKQTRKFYLAGKVGGFKHRIAEQIAPDIAEFVCSDGTEHSEHGWGNGLGTHAIGGLFQPVQDAFVHVARDCEMLIAVIDTPDAFGTIAEIAYTSGSSMASMMILKMPREDGDWAAMVDAYWFVSNFPNVFPIQVSTDEQAIRCLSNLVSIESPIEWGFYWAAMRFAPDLFHNLIAQAKFNTGEFTYRVDFVVHDDKGIVLGVELDGHDSHKTKEQRTHDARKDRFFQQFGLDIVRFTGTELTADPERCIKEFVNLVKG